MKNNVNDKVLKVAIANAAEEAGVRTSDLLAANIISKTDGLFEMIASTEWSNIICYADITDGSILGFKTEPKSIETLMDEMRTVTVKRNIFAKVS